jgi:hypothetical protein
VLGVLLLHNLVNFVEFCLFYSIVAHCTSRSNRSSGYNLFHVYISLYISGCIKFGLCNIFVVKFDNRSAQTLFSLDL